MSKKIAFEKSILQSIATQNNGFEKPKCAECGKPLEPQKANYEVRRRLYCNSCEAVAKVKETWQPMFTGGSISGVYTLDSNGKIVPARR